MKKQNGFTFFELMLVACIIGILVTVALPAYFNYLKRARITDALYMSSDARQNIATFYRYTGDFPANNRAAGLPVPTDINSRYVKSLHIENGAIHITFSDVNQMLAGKHVTLRPVIVKNSPTTPIYFSCGYSVVTSEKHAVIGENKTDVDNTWLTGTCSRPSQ